MENIISIELSGFIEYIYVDNWQTIKLNQEDGYKIDLVYRLKEILESYPNKQFNVEYYLSDIKLNKNQLQEKFLEKLFGKIEAEFESNSYYYSSMTYGTDYDTNLKIGGHDLFRELRDMEGKFIYLTVNLK